MNISDIVNAHSSLWDGVSGKEASDDTRSFRSMWSSGFNLVTQNMKKDSPNTRWIQADPSGRRITWLFHRGRYAGRVREYDTNGTHVVEVHKLSPERLIHREEHEKS